METFFDYSKYNRKLFVKEVQRYCSAEDFILAMVRNEFLGLKIPQCGSHNQLYFFEKKIGKNPYEFYEECIRDMKLMPVK